MERAALWGAPLDHRPSPLSPLPLASHPQAGISELSKQLSAAWKEVGEEEKKEWQAKHLVGWGAGRGREGERKGG